MHNEFDALIRDVTASAPSLGMVLVCTSGGEWRRNDVRTPGETPLEKQSARAPG